VDFGGLILFALLALGLFFGGIVVAFLGIKRSPAHLRGFGLWFGGAVMLALFGRYLYQEYLLNEVLFIAAAGGDTVQVKALLSAGASPNACWEDGTSAIRAAKRNGHKDVVTLLEEAGADK
jgi:Ankyrin repeats (many copies)